MMMVLGQRERETDNCTSDGIERLTKIPRGEKQREFFRDSEKCHGSSEIGKTHKGIEAGGKFSRGENETLSCQAQETGVNRERKQRPAGKMATKITWALIKHHKCFI